MNQWFQQLEQEKEKWGIHELAIIPTRSLIFSDGVRQLCESNSCGLYGKTWACPPGVGTMQECKDKICSYEYLFVYTTKHLLEDSYDWEGMQDGKTVHRKVARDVYNFVKENHPEEMLFLGAEGCSICQKCTFPDAPCRFPDKMSPSIESYGVEVNRLAETAGIHYINGVNTVTYFSCLCFS